MLVRTEKIDPKDYPFRHLVEQTAHLDTDELRHTIQPIIQIIDKDFKGREHQFCDKEQLCPLGKYRRPKLLVEAESKGFTSSLEMYNADKKAEEDKKQKEIDDLKALVQSLVAKLK
jgi:hypothetical protein